MSKQKPNQKQNPYGVFAVWAIVGVIFLLTVIPFSFLAFIAYSANWWPEFFLPIFGAGIVLWLHLTAKFWKKAVPQNPEYTNTLMRNADGTMTPITEPGPFYLPPGSKIEGNQITRTVRVTKIDTKVVLQDDVTLQITGQVRWIFSSNPAKLARQNELGNLLEETVETTINEGVNNALDVAVAKSKKYTTLRNALNARGGFLSEVEQVFRSTSKTELEESLGVEILNQNLKGFQLSVKMTDAIEEILNEQYQDQRERENIEAAADRRIAKGVDPSEAYDQAVAEIKGTNQRFSGKGARAVPIVAGQPQDSGE